jgi:sterol desaturase/sphingolipid hydroxylase (fatty acid hydroxylase superfamily)
MEFNEILNAKINWFIHSASYASQSILVFGYFLFLYFFVGTLFQFICKKLESRKIIFKIVPEVIAKKQLFFEIRYSLISIVIFAFSGWPIIYFVRNGTISLEKTSIITVIIGVILLNIWNEIHFFLVHRLMHTKWFMKHIHIIHHRSRIPTIYSVYSFHPIEAMLLSTVPFLLALVLPLSPVAIAIYPFTSIVLNLIGHCNYRVWKTEGPSWFRLATSHNEHHVIGKQNFGFASSLLDKLFNHKK